MPTRLLSAAIRAVEKKNMGYRHMRFSATSASLTCPWPGAGAPSSAQCAASSRPRASGCPMTTRSLPAHVDGCSAGWPLRLLDACRPSLANLFTDRAIHQRIARRFENLKVVLSTGIRNPMRSALARSIVMCSPSTVRASPCAFISMGLSPDWLLPAALHVLRPEGRAPRAALPAMTSMPHQRAPR